MSQQPITNVVKSHPVGRKDNLQKICKDLNIQYDEKNDSNAVLQSNIANHTQQHPEADALVRALAKDMIKELKQNKSTEISQNTDKTLVDNTGGDNTVVDLTLTTQFIADSQVSLFDDPTQPTATPTAPTSPTAALIDESPNENDLKRKLSDSTISDDVDDLVMENKRQKTIIDDLLQTIRDERAEAKQERDDLKTFFIETIATDNKQREKYFNDKFEQIDNAFKVISNKTDEVSKCVKGMGKKLQNQCSNPSSSSAASATPLTPTAPPFIPSMPSLISTTPPPPTVLAAPPQIPTAPPAAESAPPTAPTTPPLTPSDKRPTATTTTTRPTRTTNSSRVQEKPILLLISDSNGYDLNWKVKPSSTFIKRYRYTIDKAIEDVPAIAEPEKVTDIIFQVGLNDSRAGLSASAIQEKHLDMQLLYNERFPNARHHVTLLPPITTKSKEVNVQLQKLCSYTESNCISTKVFSDRASGKIRRDHMRDYLHYNYRGVCLLTEEIQKSLNSTSNIGSKRLSVMRSMNIEPQPASPMEQ